MSGMYCDHCHKLKPCLIDMGTQERCDCKPSVKPASRCKCNDPEACKNGDFEIVPDTLENCPHVYGHGVKVTSCSICEPSVKDEAPTDFRYKAICPRCEVVYVFPHIEKRFDSYWCDCTEPPTEVKVLLNG